MGEWGQPADNGEVSLAGGGVQASGQRASPGYLKARSMTTSLLVTKLFTRKSLCCLFTLSFLLVWLLLDSHRFMHFIQIYKYILIYINIYKPSSSKCLTLFCFKGENIPPQSFTLRVNQVLYYILFYELCSTS